MSGSNTSSGSGSGSSGTTHGLSTQLRPFIIFIVAVKIVFVVSAIATVIISHMPNSSPKKNRTMAAVKRQTEFLFIASMSVLLLLHFRPGATVCPDHHTSILFFIFGCLLLLTADWGAFLGGSLLLKALHRG